MDDPLQSDDLQSPGSPPDKCDVCGRAPREDEDYVFEWRVRVPASEELPNVLCMDCIAKAYGVADDPQETCIRCGRDRDFDLAMWLRGSEGAVCPQCFTIEERNIAYLLEQRKGRGS